ncbi:MULTISPECIES: GNAT family N-acetyltransferase [Aeromonas]|jgi:predicted N-acetyltransferase YhbS|uniref:GNAT family N-acetyltransferase n=1 Tax=Aeromonas TaxID=642 RepID=UPI001CCF8D5C|nr:MULTISPECIES: GNAT family N-acetyltransferase [Aeromonas]MCS3458970.1 putative N-acetyltransferase YhbS [Aeromonas sp. BIGb0445]
MTLLLSLQPSAPGAVSGAQPPLLMELVAEIDLSPHQHEGITALRNTCFPAYALPRSYFKQRPHLRGLVWQGDQLVGHVGLDQRMIAVGDQPVAILGLIDLCVAPQLRGQGLASAMLAELQVFAHSKALDYLFLIAEDPSLYLANGFVQITQYCSWLRINDFKNYGVAVELLDDILIKAVGDAPWPDRPIDLLGYMF